MVGSRLGEDGATDGLNMFGDLPVWGVSVGRTDPAPSVNEIPGSGGKHKQWASFLSLTMLAKV